MMKIRIATCVLALSLAAVTVYVGTRINPDEAFDVRTPMFRYAFANPA